MNHACRQIILNACQAESIGKVEPVQSLWSNYGSIVRCKLQGGTTGSVIVKHVRLSAPTQHPRGWNSDTSHLRKMRSYQIETDWYRHWSTHCGASCRIASCLGYGTFDNEIVIVLEDLDAAGFPRRKNAVTTSELQACLTWLANFHATFIGCRPEHLWPTGTYWHLDTRPDELKVLKDQPLKKAAATIDRKLNNSPFQTFVHGDAKLANFCFSADGKHVAAVDFQYVGGGCGMKDVAYFIGSCLNEDECQTRENELLDYYFQAFAQAIKNKGKPVDAEAVEQDWRNLYPVAWTDFHRFLKGWSPGHWKINSYSERLAREVIAALNH